MGNYAPRWANKYAWEVNPLLPSVPLERTQGEMGATLGAIRRTRSSWRLSAALRRHALGRQTRSAALWWWRRGGAKRWWIRSALMEKQALKLGCDILELSVEQLRKQMAAL